MQLAAILWSGPIRSRVAWLSNQAKLEAELDLCLSCVQVEGAREEECIARLGPLGRQLEPLLFLAKRLWSLPKPEMPEDRRRAVLERIIGLPEGR